MLDNYSETAKTALERCGVAVFPDRDAQVRTVVVDKDACSKNRRIGRDHLFNVAVEYPPKFCGISGSEHTKSVRASDDVALSCDRQ